MRCEDGNVAPVDIPGIDPERIPVHIAPTEHNLRYLTTKAERMGHDLPLPVVTTEEV